MAIYIKAIVLAFVLIFLAESSSAPVDDQTSNTQVDLLAVDDLPQADSQSVDITRAKRHGYGGYGGYGKAQMSLGLAHGVTRDFRDKAVDYRHSEI